MTGYYPGGVDLVQRAERLPNLHTGGGRDHRTASQYLTDLINEAEVSLMRSASWRAGRPLADHRPECDCPPTLAGCVERRTWHTSQGLTVAAGARLNPPDRP